MKVYIITQVVDTEYCGTENVAVFDDEKKAKQYVEEHQETFEHWSGMVYEIYSIEEWEIS